MQSPVMNIMPLSVTDNERPTFTFCPSDVTVYVQDNATSGNVTWTVPVAEDNVNVVSLLTTSSQGTYNVGSYSVVYRASDAAGNEELCSFTVEVIGEYTCTSTMGINMLHLSKSCGFFII